MRSAGAPTSATASTGRKCWTGSTASNPVQRLRMGGLRAALSPDSVLRAAAPDFRGGALPCADPLPCDDAEVCKWPGDGFYSGHVVLKNNRSEIFRDPPFEERKIRDGERRTDNVAGEVRGVERRLVDGNRHIGLNRVGKDTGVRTGTSGAGESRWIGLVDSDADATINPRAIAIKSAGTLKCERIDRRPGRSCERR